MSDETEWKTIRIPKGVYEDAKDRKQEHGVTWGEYIDPHSWHSVFEEPKEMPGDAELVKTDAEAITEFLDDALDTASMAADPGATEEAVDDLTREVRKAQELAEQARDAAQRVEEGMGR